MADSPNRGPGHRADATAAPVGAHPRATGFLGVSAAAIADGLVDPRILLAWLLSFVGAPSLVGLLVPVREGVGLLSRSLDTHALRPGRRKRVWAAAALLQGLAALGIAVSSLFLWGQTAGWTIVALLLLVALAAGPAAAAAESLLARSRLRAAAAIGAAAVALFALALLLELGPRGALVIWALMAAGGLWLLAAPTVLALRDPRFPSAAAEPGRRGLAPLRADPRLRRLILARLLLVPAALAPPYLVALVSGNPGRGLAALGGLLLASTLAQVLTRPVLDRLGGDPARFFAGAAGSAAAALALACLADAAGWLAALPGLLPLLVFATVTAERSARLDVGSAQSPEASAALRIATALALLAGALFAPLAAAMGARGVLLLLAAMLALAVPALLRLGSSGRHADGA